MMEKYESDIDPNIFRQNIKYLEELKYEPLEIDRHESITPKTNKGPLNPESKKGFFDKVQESLFKLLKNNEDEEFYKTVQGNFVNKEVLGTFLEQEQKSLEAFTTDKLYIKKYQYNESETSKVLRFCINSLNKNLKQWIEEKYNPIATNTIKISDTISLLSKQSKQDQFIEKIQAYNTQSVEQITHIENFVVKQAINYLDGAERKTVLVDLFARHNKSGTYEEDYVDKGKKYKAGQIKLTKDSNIETHTVVLYKQDNKYLVIDPSNAEFSSVLVGADQNIRICISQNFKIYKPNDTVGYDKNMWRDCIDIAVKLAFNLNNYNQDIALKKIKEYEFIDDNSLRNNISIEAITNQQEMSGYFPKILEEYNARAKQSSNIIESQYTSLYLKLLNKNNLLLEEKLENSIFTHQKKNYTNKDYLSTYISNKILEHANYIGNLVEGNKIIEKYLVEIDGFNLEQEMKLIGEGEI